MENKIYYLDSVEETSNKIYENRNSLQELISETKLTNSSTQTNTREIYQDKLNTSSLSMQFHVPIIYEDKTQIQKNLYINSSTNSGADCKKKYSQNVINLEKLNDNENNKINKFNKLLTKKTKKNSVSSNNSQKEKKNNKKIEKITHDKSSKDNMNKKIKTYFIGNILKWINYTLPNYEKLLKIKNSYITNLSKKDNLNVISSTLKDFFSQDISEIYTSFSKKADYNKKLIEKFYNIVQSSSVFNSIYYKKYKLVISKLDLTFEEAYQIFLDRELTEDLKNKICEDINESSPSLEKEDNKREERVKEFLEGYPLKNDLIKSEIEKSSDKDSYIKNLDNACDCFIEWFKLKRTKSKSQKKFEK